MDKVLEMLKKYLPDDVYCCETPGVIHYFPNEQEMYEGGSADGIHLLMIVSY